MSSFTQSERRLELRTPLGDDVLLLTRLHGHEEMSRLFSYQLEMLSKESTIAARDIVGHPVTIRLRLNDGGERFFHGVVSEFSYSGSDDRFSHYSARVVPWFWFLKLRRNCRIFQEQTVQEIIESIFGELGFADFEFNLSGTHPAREYCVQYRESDFDFVSRLLEKEGIFYWFRHEDGKHTMVLSDGAAGYEDAPENEVEMSANLSDGIIGDQLTSWRHSYEYRSGKCAHKDWDFKNPTANLLSSTSTVVDLDGIDKFELYDYPGLYTDKGLGDTEINYRMEEDEAGYDLVHAESKCRTFFAGAKFTVTKHHNDGEVGTEWVISRIEHSAEDFGSYRSGAQGASFDYKNSLTCMPADRVFRPERLTPPAVVRGAQTAIVVGPSGEEIYTDEYGRVKVQFHWDRNGQNDESSSCWIRVSQPWAGANWGAVFLPRIGQEVVVDFLEGDPDRPLIVGRVYNASQMPPYELPANKTQSGIKTRSTPDGSEANFNEIRFEDKKGEEELYIHAEKDENIIVENDKTEGVGHDETIDIGNDRTETVGNNESLTVAKNRTRAVGGNETVSVAKNRTHSVGVNEAISVGAAQEIAVGAGRAIAVGAGQSVSIGENLAETVGEDHSLEVGKSQSIQIGKKLVIDVGDEITIKTGKASIKMKKDGTITISGKDITLKGSGKIDVKASKNITMKGQKVLAN